MRPGFLLRLFSRGCGQEGGKTKCHVNFFWYANFSIVLDQNIRGGGSVSGEGKHLQMGQPPKKAKVSL